MRWSLLLGLLLVAGPVTAQTVINPTTVEFAPSPDHDATIEGQPVVQTYEARYFVVGSSTVVCAVGLGKPTPVSGLISLPLPLTCVPTSWSTRYEVRVAAVGVTGAGVSAASNPFASAAEPTAPGTPVVRR